MLAAHPRKYGAGRPSATFDLGPSTFDCCFSIFDLGSLIAAPPRVPDVAVNA
jgi:hypothetical protein